MKRLLLAIAIVFIWAAQGMAVESCSGSLENFVTHSGRYMQKYTWTWVSAADGTASCTAVPLYGELVKVVTDPGAAAPSDNYDIDINEGVTDIMGSALDNRDTANNETAFPLKGTDQINSVWLSGDITAEVSAAGDTKGGQIILVIIP